MVMGIVIALFYLSKSYNDWVKCAQHEMANNSIQQIQLFFGDTYAEQKIDTSGRLPEFFNDDGVYREQGYGHR